MRRSDWVLLTPKQQLFYKNKMKLYFQKYRQEKAEKVNKIARLSRLRRKVNVLNIYGGCKCCWCGEHDITVLTIDHINNNGASHRKNNPELGRGGRIYDWLKKNNYPSGYQVLCFNCNFVKFLNNGILPENRKNKYVDTKVI